MRPGNVDYRHPHLWAILLLSAGLLLTWFAYAPGLSGQLHFDDHHNLQGLAKVTDTESAFDFVISGTAGPLGRPLALASFVPEAHAWPDTPSAFLKTNIAIHLLNGLLVTWFLYLLGRARQMDERPAAIAAAAAASIWMLMPLLASSSLFIVQRMTTLSAFFALLGAVGYVHARLSIHQRPVAALTGMSFFLGLGGLLAVLAKENGALIFLFILAAEATLLPRPRNILPGLWRTWFTVVLLVPLVVLIIFLFSSLPYSEDVVMRRGFTALERVATQAEILWKYLYLAFVPNIPDLGPYHDDYPARKDLLNLVTIASVAGWVAVVAIAVKFRHKAPLFAFAVAWYLLGHLLESTWLSLELYFEHRNYLPLVGPTYALAATAVGLTESLRKLAAIVGLAYAGLLGAILFSTTTLWGSPVLAAEMWHIYKPGSVRAAQNLAGALEKQGHRSASLRLLNRFTQNNSGSEVLEIQILLLSCMLEPKTDHSSQLKSTRNALSVTGFQHSIAGTLGSIYDLVREDQCSSISDQDVYEMGEALLSNPKFTATISRHNTHIVLARIGIDRRDFSLAMSHMEAALELNQNPKTLMLAVGLLNSGGRHDISKEFLREARTWTPPRNPFLARKWHEELDQLETVLNNSAADQDRKPIEVTDGVD